MQDARSVKRKVKDEQDFTPWPYKKRAATAARHLMSPVNYEQIKAFLECYVPDVFRSATSYRSSRDHELPCGCWARHFSDSIRE